VYLLSSKSSFKAVFISVALITSLVSSQAWAINYALLVGVSNYPGLEKGSQLVGPANDVKLVREILKNKDFADDHVQVLADGVSGDPTRKNILASLDKIVSQAKTGDFVYLHFAGHGSQQPSPKDKVPHEPDGKDEIFLPRDIGKWNDSFSTVDNALVNTEMHHAIDKIRDKGAFVWVVFDSCHSGNMTRGAPSDEIRFRKVEPVALGIPQKLMDAAESDAIKSRGEPQPKTGIMGSVTADAPGKGGFVAFYAAQTVETAPEMRLPAGEPNREAHGLFSYVMAETMEKYQGITYRQLGQQVLQRYAALGMNTPTPLFEGTALDAPLFGVNAKDAVRQWPLQINKGELSIGAGSLQQFSEGAIFAVVPTAASSEKEIVGYLRGDKLTPLSSIVSPIAYGEKLVSTPEQLKAGMYVRLVDPNLRLSLSVSLPPASKKNSALEKVARQSLLDLRTKLEKEMRIEWVEAGKASDLRLILSNDKLWLLPPDGLLVQEGKNKSHSIDLNISKDKLDEKITESFRIISKATNLLRLANFFGSKDSSGVAKGLEVKATIIRQKGGERVPLDIASIPEFHDKDQVEFSFKNKGRTMVDVTALYIDSEYGITALYPEAGRLNRIEAGGDDTMKIEINADTTGAERLILIAVEAQAESPRSDFSFLAQSQLDRTRGGVSRSIDAMFSDTGFGVTTRSAKVARSPIEDADVKVYGWKVVGD
jgi:hypothetical protein